MNKIQTSLCVFIHFSKYFYIPRYVKIYVDEISKYFDQVILVTNERSVEENIAFNNIKISTVFVKNEGYDLGMFYKVFRTIEISKYSQIACINDSNVLFNQLLPIFNWSKTQQADFWGVIDSNQKPWFSTHHNNYHIQSHFIVFNRNALLKLPAFFCTLNIQDILNEKDPVKLRQTVIDKWEIGLSQFLIKEGLSCASFIDSSLYSKLYLSGKQTNVGLKLYPELIRSGFPLIKMKVITKTKLKDIFRSESYWKNLIRQYGNPNWDIESLIEELIQIRNDSGNQPFIKIKRKYLQFWSLIFSKTINPIKLT
jgi:lipopolysaccharide biosynthesis protein